MGQQAGLSLCEVCMPVGGWEQRNKLRTSFLDDGKSFEEKKARWQESVWVLGAGGRSTKFGEWSGNPSLPGGDTCPEGQEGSGLGGAGRGVRAQVLGTFSRAWTIFSLWWEAMGRFFRERVQCSKKQHWGQDLPAFWPASWAWRSLSCSLLKWGSWEQFSELPLALKFPLGVGMWLGGIPKSHLSPTWGPKPQRPWGLSGSVPLGAWELWWTGEGHSVHRAGCFWTPVIVPWEMEGPRVARPSDSVREARNPDVGGNPWLTSIPN